MLLADLGLPHPEAAKLLHVSLRTLQNWLSGTHQVPYMAYKLLRLMRYAELPGKEWAGWYFYGGMLVTPEGRTISAKESGWWSMLVQQAQGFLKLYEERGRLLTELQALRAAQPEGEAGACGCGCPAKAQPDGAPAPAGANLLPEHFRKSQGTRPWIPGQRGPY
ncbi:MAG: VC1465 family Xer recombination activation factor [Pseudomonadota bacterium]